MLMLRMLWCRDQAFVHRRTGLARHHLTCEPAVPVSSRPRAEDHSRFRRRSADLGRRRDATGHGRATARDRRAPGPPCARPARVTHTLADMIRARIFAIAMGYEVADDLDHLRRDPAFKLACGRLPDSGDDLCSQPTLSARGRTSPARRGPPVLSHVAIGRVLLAKGSSPLKRDPDRDRDRAKAKKLMLVKAVARSLTWRPDRPVALKRQSPIVGPRLAYDALNICTERDVRPPPLAPSAGQLPRECRQAHRWHQIA